MGAAAFREISLLMAQMRRVSSAAVNKRLALVGSSISAYKVLFRLVHDPEVAQHELAWDAAMDPAAISRLIRSMAKDGLVSTRVDPTDKRQRFVRLTSKGRELERTLSPVVDVALEPYHAVLSDDEQAQLLRLLRKACEGVMAKAQEAASLSPRAEARTPEPRHAHSTMPAKRAR